MRPASLCFNETISAAHHGLQLFLTISFLLDVKRVLVIVGNEETYLILGKWPPQPCFLPRERFFCLRAVKMFTLQNLTS